MSLSAWLSLYVSGDCFDAILVVFQLQNFSRAVNALGKRKVFPGKRTACVSVCVGAYLCLDVCECSLMPVCIDVFMFLHTDVCISAVISFYLSFKGVT